MNIEKNYELEVHDVAKSINSEGNLITLTGDAGNEEAVLDFINFVEEFSPWDELNGSLDAITALWERQDVINTAFDFSHALDMVTIRKVNG